MNLTYKYYYMLKIVKFYKSLYSSINCQQINELSCKNEGTYSLTYFIGEIQE